MGELPFPLSRADNYNVLTRYEKFSGCDLSRFYTLFMGIRGK